MLMPGCTHQGRVDVCVQSYLKIGLRYICHTSVMCTATQHCLYVCIFLTTLPQPYGRWQLKWLLGNQICPPNACNTTSKKPKKHQQFPPVWLDCSYKLLPASGSTYPRTRACPSSAHLQRDSVYSSVKFFSIFTSSYIWIFWSYAYIFR